MIVLRVMPILPLHMINDGGCFRMPGKKAIFTKTNNLGTLDVLLHKQDGEAYVETRPACKCKTSNGKIFTEDWFFMVEEI